METRNYLKWSELQGKPVKIPTQGLTAGTIEDFYFEPDTQSIDSLLVRTRVNGDFALPATSIKTISADGVTIPNEQMMTRTLPPLPLGSTLPAHKIINEKGKDLGKVSEVWLGINPPVALRIAGVEVADTRSRAKRFNSDAIQQYTDDTITVQQ